jgi:hypothetical protein
MRGSKEERRKGGKEGRRKGGKKERKKERGVFIILIEETRSIPISQDTTNA